MKVKKVDSNNRAPHTPQFNIHPFADPIMYLSDKTSTNLQIDKKKPLVRLRDKLKDNKHNTQIYILLSSSDITRRSHKM